jgi:hypothetical protein
MIEPVPFGVIAISPFDADTIDCPLTSRFPPSCGVVSSTMFERPAVSAPHVKS